MRNGRQLLTKKWAKSLENPKGKKYQVCLYPQASALALVQVNCCPWMDCIAVNPFHRINSKGFTSTLKDLELTLELIHFIASSLKDSLKDSMHHTALGDWHARLRARLARHPRILEFQRGETKSHASSRASMCFHLPYWPVFLPTCVCFDGTRGPV